MELNNKPNIIIFSSLDLASGNSAASSRIINYAKALANYNNVYILSTYQDEYISDDFLELFPNIYTQRRKGSSGKKKNNISRLKQGIKTLLELSLSLKGKTSFLYYPSSQSIEIFLIAYMLRIQRKERVFLEFNEVRQYSDVYEGLSLSDGLYNYIKYSYWKKFAALTEKVYNRFNGLICISTNIAKYAEPYHVNSIIVPVLGSHTVKVGSAKFYDREKAFKIAFCGTIGLQKERLPEFMECILSLIRMGYKVQFDLFGPIQKKYISQFREITSNKQAENAITYKGVLEGSQIREALADYHLLVIPRGNSLQNHYGFSTKFAEYLSCDVPILATDVSDIGKYIVDGVSGFLVVPDNDEMMVKKIAEIISNYNEVEYTVRENAAIVLSNIHYDKYSEKLNSFLNA